ncbi:hypothetical protein MAM1_0002c00243 [Mucor ambiguus]|uniref:WWE domain-containing protein n=1 Tax=Mucor ambiguus TaxID=91626 RepID=A0A0C9M3V5_9FUNG|nr:hypothetical protein MAM1_0002c00243 [Mucor ambiguus]
MAIQWVYANGSQWVPLDSKAQNKIEALWSNNYSTWIDCRAFQTAVYIDLDQMALLCNGYSYTIARRTG